MPEIKLADKPTLDQIDSRVDVATSTRAPANTALSNTVWTNALASNLGTLASGGGSSVIKSVQRGVFSFATHLYTDHNISISAVNMSKSIVLASQFLNYWDGGGAGVTKFYLSSANTITMSGYSQTVGNHHICWQVIEFN